MRAALFSILLLLSMVAAAEAAQVPTADETATLTALVDQEVGDTCDGWYSRSRPLPLVTDDRTWGIATVVCEYSSQPSGAGTAVWTVWAHRSSATSADWTVVRPTEASRVPPCTGEGGLFATVPLAVVRELHAECYDPSSGKGYEPSPNLRFDPYWNVKHEFDDLGQSISLDSLSEVNGRGGGLFSITKDGPPLGSGPNPTPATLRDAFGTPRRRGCQARWPRIGLVAKVCGGRLTKLTLTGPWQFSVSAETTEDVTGEVVRVGDAVPLARYLDRGLAKLPANGRLRLPRMRIAQTRVTIHVVSRDDRITAVEISLRAPGPR